MGLVIGIVLGTLIATARVVPKTNVFVKVLEKSHRFMSAFSGARPWLCSFWFSIMF